MFTTQQSFSRRRFLAQRGQSIIVALLVLLLLGLSGALFVTIIARNLINARHANRVVTADQYARAGITFADAQMSSSIDGADWRPPLQFALATPPTGARELARYNLNKPATANANDPDLEYLQAGYARYNTGAGRFLLRVTYDPVNLANAAVAPGKYLKIESIGREGVIDPLDPTTYTNNRSTDRTQAYQVAYKPIGITDYARFETNPDKRSDIANLGVASEFYADNTDGGIATPGVFDFSSVGSANSAPTLQEYPVLTTYGASDAYLKSSANPPVFYANPNAGSGAAVPAGFASALGGGSIHANMTVRFFGLNVMYLNGAGANAPLFQDTAEIAGDLLLDSYDNKNPLDTTSGTATAGQQAALVLNPTNLANPTTGKFIAPSNSSGANGSFDTQGGLIRDGSMQNDPAGLPRGITRLEPPVLDAQDTASQMPRYRAIAMNSAPRNDPATGKAYVNTTGISPSQYGYGRAIYVNNPTDIQPDSAAIGGGSTLTDEWLHGGSPSSMGVAKGNWNGLFYNPPGVSITLGQLIPPASGTGAGSYGIRLVRSAGDHFAAPDGTTSAGPEMDVPYADLDTDTTGKASDNDIIIYAEGNVRVHGILSPVEPVGTGTGTQVIPRHITIVTDGTAYIEGNLLKGDPDSSISVLAHDYVCINTTQFLAGSNVEDPTGSSQTPVVPSQTDTLTLDADHSLLQEFNFGLTGADTPATKYGASTLALYIAAGPAGPGSATADINITDATNTSVLQTVPLPWTFSTFTHLTYDLSSDATTLLSTPTATNTFFNALGTDLFHLSVSKAPGTENGANNDQDVALERVAVLPMDIRIEAVLYAQTRSFFVIPGEWFNTNPDDNLAKYLSTATRPDLSGLGTASTQYTAAYPSVSRFPMYGQPIDLKITIDGSVSEARPADIAAQTAWMQKWGWIPQYHGSLVLGAPTEMAGHTLAVAAGQAGQPAIGLQIIYDPQAGYPYDPFSATIGGAVVAAHYLRSDQYGRPLPFTPKLPVSTGLLYSGESGEPPLLQ